VIKSILGVKLGMTSIFDEDGHLIPVTVVEAASVTVTQVKTEETDGYCAVQLGFGEKKPQRTNKAEIGHARKAETAPKRKLVEVRVTAEEIGEYSLGQTLSVADMGFEAGDYVDAVGVSKGKGYQGVMKRHNYGGFKATHGAHESQRHGGSIGCSATPARVRKGTKMAGQMGAERVTVQNLTVAEVRPEENLLLILGAVPGHKQGMVMVSKAKKRQRKAGEEAAA